MLEQVLLRFPPALLPGRLRNDRLPAIVVVWVKTHRIRRRRTCEFHKRTGAAIRQFLKYRSEDIGCFGLGSKSTSQKMATLVKYFPRHGPNDLAEIIVGYGKPNRPPAFRYAKRNDIAIRHVVFGDVPVELLQGLAQ